MNNLSIAGILALIGAALAFFFKSKSEVAIRELEIAKATAKDAPLAAKQADDEVKIKQIDSGIEQLNEERKKMRDQYLTDQQRADSWNKPKQ